MASKILRSQRPPLHGPSHCLVHARRAAANTPNGDPSGEGCSEGHAIFSEPHQTPRNPDADGQCLVVSAVARAARTISRLGGRHGMDPEPTQLRVEVPPADTATPTSGVNNSRFVPRAHRRTPRSLLYSLNPVQNVANDRPARLMRRRVLPRIQRLYAASSVPSFRLSAIQVLMKLASSRRVFRSETRVAHGSARDPAPRPNNREHQRPGRAAFGGQEHCVDARVGDRQYRLVQGLNPDDSARGKLAQLVGVYG